MPVAYRQQLSDVCGYRQRLVNRADRKVKTKHIVLIHYTKGWEKPRPEFRLCTPHGISVRSPGSEYLINKIKELESATMCTQIPRTFFAWCHFECSSLVPTTVRGTLTVSRDLNKQTHLLVLLYECYYMKHSVSFISVVPTVNCHYYWLLLLLFQGCTNFPMIEEQVQNFSCHVGDIKQASY